MEHSSHFSLSSSSLFLINSFPMTWLSCFSLALPLVVSIVLTFKKSAPQNNTRAPEDGKFHPPKSDKRAVTAFDDGAQYAEDQDCIFCFPSARELQEKSEGAWLENISRRWCPGTPGSEKD